MNSILLSSRLLMIFLVSTLAMAALRADTFGFYTYTDNGTSITITDYSKVPTGSIIIPSSIKFKPVTTIGPAAFSLTRISGVTIPDSVTEIADEAFLACPDLVKVTMSPNVARIGSSAFRDCVTLTSVSLPSAITEIKPSTFRNCKALESITIPSGVGSIKHSAFRDCTKLTAFILPSAITEIKSSTFRNCKALESITIPSGVSSIEHRAFFGCSALDRAIFVGNAPALKARVFRKTASDFTVFYNDEKKGFTWPLWNLYPSQPLGPEISVHQPTFRPLKDGKNTKHFGITRVGFTGKTKTFTIHNIGTEMLKKLRVTSTGAHRRDFVVTQPGVKKIAPGESATFDVTFLPQKHKKRRASIQIRSNDSNESPFSVKVTGDGLKYTCWELIEELLK